MSKSSNDKTAFTLSSWLLILLVSIFLTTTANYSFFDKILDVYTFENNALFLLSIAVVLTSIIAAVLAVGMMVLPRKLVAAILISIAAISSYFSDSFGIPIDAAMLQNALQTDSREAFDLIHTSMMLRIAVFGGLPLILLFMVNLKKRSFVQREIGLLKIFVFSIVGILVFLLPFTDGYASFFREHKPIRYFTNPTYPIYSVGKLIASSFRSVTDKPYVERIKEVVIGAADQERELVIVVVGETARADHFGLNGYKRETTPRLAKQKYVVSFQHAASCGTATAISLPCMFSLDGRENFDLETSRNTENVLDVIKKAGVSVLWRDNNSGSKGVANRIQYELFNTADVNPVCDEVECRDEGMLVGLDEYIKQQSGDILIVLHQMGSHGPAYYKRYPQQFSVFEPACQTLELSACTEAEIINAYDNTILYTDYFLDKIIGFLKSNSKQYETTMIYVGDHGESLGEMGVYLHGMPYIFAPKAQTHVPFIMWAGPTSDFVFSSKTQQEQVSHDDFSRLLLDVFEISAAPLPDRVGVNWNLMKK